MSAIAALQPSLWRTCRVLANRTRLRIFGCLLDQPDQSVSSVARRLRLGLPVASQYLRAMEARGLLAVRRVGARVYYRPGSETGPGHAPALVAVLRVVFRREPNPVDVVFDRATAFTHPRRLALYQALGNGTFTVNQLQSLTRMSRWALLRHLAKLKARGFVVRRAPAYALSNRLDSLGRALGSLARAQASPDVASRTSRGE